MAATALPDITNHASLLAALNAIRADVESRQEDVDNLAAWSTEMADRIQGMGEELAALDVDIHTRGNVAMLGDLVTGQQSAATRYKAATDTSVTQAALTARNAHRRHGRIQESVADAGVPMAKNTFYSAE